MLESQPQQFTFVQNDIADIGCLVEGDPKPEIQWLWQGRPIQHSHRISTFKGQIIFSFAGQLVLAFLCRLKNTIYMFYSCII
jgi:hypothetical protein